MAPDAPIEIVGIRPGEKLHEILLTADESRHSVDTGEVYVVQPEHPWWTDDSPWMTGKPLDDGFAYSSDANDEWLDAEALRNLIGMIPYGRQHVDEGDVEAVAEVLRSDWLTQGPTVERFERGRRSRRRPSCRRVLERNGGPARCRARRRTRTR